MKNPHTTPHTPNHHHTPAFTLLEMLLVIAIIAILAGIVIVAINPARQLAQARNAQRASDLRALNSAVQQYYIDNRVWPANLATTTTLTEICDTGSNEGPQQSITCDSLIDLSTLVPTYLSAIPKDPQGSIAFHNLINTAYANTPGTGYLIAVNPTTKVLELTAPKSLEYALEPVQVGTTTALTSIIVDAEIDCAVSQSQSGLINGDVVYCDSSNQMWTPTIDLPADENTVSTARNWNTSTSYCQSLDYAGFNDWYLPTCSTGVANSGCQLRQFGIDACGSYGCSPDWDLNVSGGWYWTGTTHPSHPPFAHVVHFTSGDVATHVKNDDFRRARCVRNL